MSIMIPVSWGEVFDKLTILEIKSERIDDTNKNINIRKELSEMKEVTESALLPEGMGSVINALRDINAKLWEIEDSIRDCERERRFDDEFIQLARAVYFTNDERAALKKQINVLMGSEIIEEKSYSPYN